MVKFMQKAIYPLIFVGFILFASFHVFAQDKEMTEQEFINLKNTATEKLKTKTYRVKMVGEGYKNVNDSRPSQFTSQITEYAVPDRSHSIYEIKTDQRIFREETISIGQKKYIRRNNENWKELAPELNERGSGVGIKSAVVNHEKNVEYKYKGKKNISKQESDLYEVTTTRKYKTPNYEATNITTERYWFNKEGLFLKTETEFKYNNQKITSHIIWVYEYDPNIKIETPKIN